MAALNGVLRRKGWVSCGKKQTDEAILLQPPHTHTTPTKHNNNNQQELQQAERSEGAAPPDTPHRPRRRHGHHLGADAAAPASPLSEPLLPPAAAASPAPGSADRTRSRGGRAARPSLLRAGARAFGASYWPLAGLKLANDALLLMMPLLLKLLVERVEAGGGGDGDDESDGAAAAAGGGAAAPRWLPAGPAGGFAAAALLGAAAAAKALLGAHYDYRLNVVANRARAALMGALHRQALLARASDAAACADPGTLMGVDAPRAVNLLPSLMELWAMPLQLAVAMVLLYTQVC